MWTIKEGWFPVLKSAQREKSCMRLSIKWRNASRKEPPTAENAIFHSPPAMRMPDLWPTWSRNVSRILTAKSWFTTSAPPSAHTQVPARLPCSSGARKELIRPCRECRHAVLWIRLYRECRFQAFSRARVICEANLVLLNEAASAAECQKHFSRSAVIRKISLPQRLIRASWRVNVFPCVHADFLFTDTLNMLHIYQIGNSHPHKLVVWT